MTGTGLSIITDNNKFSYNKAVNTINRHQKENIAKLEWALSNVINEITPFQKAIAELAVSIDSLKKQVFLNQCLIDNWEKSAPYSYPIELLD